MHFLDKWQSISEQKSGKRSRVKSGKHAPDFDTGRRAGNPASPCQEVRPHNSVPERSISIVKCFCCFLSLSPGGSETVSEYHDDDGTWGPIHDDDECHMTMAMTRQRFSLFLVRQLAVRDTIGSV